RSILAAAAVAADERYGAETRNPFDALGYRFESERRQGRLIHQATLLDAGGRTVAGRADEVQFVLGSRMRGCDYLIDRNGYVFQSAISWFSQKRLWGLSPGFHESSVAGRPVQPVCLYCHSNHVRPVPDTDNR